jgi:hypothetical protein
VCKVAQKNSSFGKTSEFCWLAQILFACLFVCLIVFWGDGRENIYLKV